MVFRSCFFLDSGPANLSLSHMGAAGEMGGYQLGNRGHQSLPVAKDVGLGTLRGQQRVESTLEGYKAVEAEGVARVLESVAHGLLDPLF